MHLSAVVLAALLALAPASRGVLMSYTFTQGGFTDGATLSGGFSGEDVNGDGILTGYLATAPEIPDFYVTYSGSSAVPAFSPFDAFYSVAFNLNNNGLFFSQVQFVGGGIFGPPHRFLSVSPGAVSITFDDGLTLVDYSSAPLIVTLRSVNGAPFDGAPVPDSSSSLALLALSCAALVAFVHLAKDRAQWA